MPEEKKVSLLTSSSSSESGGGGGEFRAVFQRHGGGRSGGCGGPLARLCRKKEEVRRLRAMKPYTCRRIPTYPLQGTFSSSLGVMLSMLGSVVGTGNIWRFPRIVANHADSGGKQTTALLMQ